MRFTIKAFRRLEPVAVTLEAADAQEARSLALAQGLTVFEIRADRHWALPLRARRGDFPLLQFSHSLLILLDAGLSIVEAIDTLADRETRPDTKRVLGAVLDHLRHGLPLSTALERQGGAFPALYVATVRANERTGSLNEAISRYIAYLGQAEQMRKRVVGAAVYPAMVLGVGVLVIGFLLVYVVPRFSLAFQDLGDRIPYLSQLLLQWGRYANEHGAALLAGAVAAVGLAAHGLGRPAVRRALGRLLLRAPRIGGYLRVYQLARFYRSLGMLLQAGIPILAALDMAAGLMPPSLQAGLAAARRRISEGSAVSSAFEAAGLTTAVSLRLLRVAEQTGRMGELLQRTASFHDDEVSQAIDWFLRLFEPLLMVGIGLVIGLVVLLMYAPIFELAGSLQ